MKNRGLFQCKAEPNSGFLIAELLTALALLILLCTAFMGFIGTITRQEHATHHLLQAVTKIQSRYPDHELPRDFKLQAKPLSIPLPEGIDQYLHEHVVRQTKPKLLSITWCDGKKERTISCIRCGEQL